MPLLGTLSRAFQSVSKHQLQHRSMSSTTTAAAAKRGSVLVSAAEARPSIFLKPCPLGLSVDTWPCRRLDQQSLGCSSRCDVGSKQVVLFDVCLELMGGHLQMAHAQRSSQCIPRIQREAFAWCQILGSCSVLASARLMMQADMGSI